MTTFYAGQRVRAATLEQFVPMYVEKGTNESVVSSTTLQNDDELFLANIPPATWELKGELWMSGTSGINQDFKCAFAFPTGVISWSGVSVHPNWSNVDGSRDVEAAGLVNISSSPTSSKSFGTITGADVPVQIVGHLVNTAAGTLQLQWAQNTSNADDTTLLAGSWLSLRRMVIT